MYPIELTGPMAAELNSIGFESLTTPDAVEAALDSQEGTTLVVVNSVCGCAAANARPGVKYSLSGEKRPDKLVTVFAGVDKEATDKAREYLIKSCDLHEVILCPGGTFTSTSSKTCILFYTKKKERKDI